MGELLYGVEYDSHLGLYRWQVAPGQRLLNSGMEPFYPPLRVVALGGGTGLPIFLRGLKAAFFPPGRRGIPEKERKRITAIVTVADDGGSSGRLRQAYHVLPPGDIRNCLLALSDHPKMAAIFDFRFDGEADVGDHSLGNLILTALSQLERDFAKAVELGSGILEIRGQVFPATADEVTLVAEFDHGAMVEGESRIASIRRPIRRVFLRPEGASVLSEVREAIAAADLIVIAPGSLYTSLISVLVIGELAEAIARSKARVILVMNLMTEPGETEGYTAADHIAAIRRHAPQINIHDVLLNAAPISKEMMERYAAEGAVPIRADLESIEDLGCRPLAKDLLGSGPKARHDPHKLAQAALELALERSR